MRKPGKVQKPKAAFVEDVLICLDLHDHNFKAAMAEIQAIAQRHGVTKDDWLQWGTARIVEEWAQAELVKCYERAGFFNPERLVRLDHEHLVLHRQATRDHCARETAYLQQHFAAERLVLVAERVAGFCAERDALFDGFPASATYAEVLTERQKQEAPDHA